LTTVILYSQQACTNHELQTIVTRWATKFLLFENVSLMKYSKKSLPEILSEDKTSDAEIQMPL